ncbi:PTS system glucose-specific EIIA component [invertebrate metagenome]|uniref:PTS system glucose-specific EIIA component n=1 Tax=invertebrate metagenome TaxID=1711999 RepID=A0A2H9T5M5_9ZZZZ
MGLFSAFRKSAPVKIQLMAPVSGDVIALEEVPDDVFAQKIVGDGLAINPTGDRMVAPCDGTIGKIFDTNHAFSMETADGVELFVHFGVDTVELKGEGFKRIATEGQSVKAGDAVISFDLKSLRKNAKSVLTPIIISNMDDVASLDKTEANTVEAGNDIVLTLQMKK